MRRLETSRWDRGCLAGVPLDQLEAEYAALEPQRPHQVGDLEVDVSNVDLKVDRAWHVVDVRACQRPFPTAYCLTRTRSSRLP
jgi:hypothetical protein